jgi:hypothetical protein
MKLSPWAVRSAFLKHSVLKSSLVRFFGPKKGQLGPDWLHQDPSSWKNQTGPGSTGHKRLPSVAELVVTSRFMDQFLTSYNRFQPG